MSAPTRQRAIASVFAVLKAAGAEKLPPAFSAELVDAIAATATNHHASAAVSDLIAEAVDVEGSKFPDDPALVDTIIEAARSGRAKVPKMPILAREQVGRRGKRR